jgi:Transport protein Trs120 or TRAPPC9, TRAPP II complex subunit
MVRTSGAEIEMIPASFILPAMSSHVRSVLFVPRKPGRLDLEGCVIKFSTCKSQEFRLFDIRGRRERDMWYDLRGGESKIKRVGLHPGRVILSEDTAISQFWNKRTIAANILPPQPVLIMERGLLGNSGIMLLEGETYSPLEPSLMRKKVVIFRIAK